jgi:DNA-directed RNA polymerase specialized sigma24 family protein
MDKVYALAKAAALKYRMVPFVEDIASLATLKLLGMAEPPSSNTVIWLACNHAAVEIWRHEKKYVAEPLWIEDGRNNLFGAVEISTVIDSTLPPHLAEAIYAFAKHLNNEDAAAELGLGVHAFKSRLQRARKILRKALRGVVAI